jgi:hypothetical protein
MAPWLKKYAKRKPGCRHTTQGGDRQRERRKEVVVMVEVEWA